MEYDEKLSQELHATWMGLFSLRSGLKLDDLSQRRWMILSEAMAVVTTLTNENIDRINQDSQRIMNTLNEATKK